MEKQKDETFPGGIEIVGGVIIENENAEILMTRSPKWSNKWVMPGGHVERGEKLVDALVREGKEETGLDLQPIDIVSFGELIDSKDFHRSAHFLYFDVYCKVIRGKIKLQKEELSEWKWIRPEEALKLDLAESYDKTLKDFIAYKHKKLMPIKIQ
jgi:nucleoside triphosphatase